MVEKMSEEAFERLRDLANGFVEIVSLLDTQAKTMSQIQRDFGADWYTSFRMAMLILALGESQAEAVLRDGRIKID